MPDNYDIQDIREKLADEIDTFYFVVPAGSTNYSLATVLAGALAAGEGLFTADVATGDDPTNANFWVEKDVLIYNTSTEETQIVYYGSAKRQQIPIYPTEEVMIPVSNLRRIHFSNSTLKDITIRVRICFKKDNI